MAYKCSQCGHTSEQAGNCPTCNIPMVEATEGEQAPSEPQAQPQEPQKTE